MPQDGPLGGRTAEEMTLNGSVLPTVKNGGAGGIRTPDLIIANDALSQLSYSPNPRPLIL